MRPHTAGVRSRRLTEPADPDATLPPRPVLCAAPEPLPEPLPGVPFAGPPTPDRVADERSSRHLLVAALGLHLGALVIAGLGPASHLGAADLALSAIVLLGGGVMLILARGLARGPGDR
ncbi:MAG TPA: hypothetical protein DD490_10140 [Acidobacteria bacterium]|nr:hypothetical protein [Acidobacteriota bacterium]